MKTLPWRNHGRVLAAARLAAVAALALAAVSAPALHADPAQKKLLSRSKSGFAFNQFGGAVAISDRFVLAGEYANDDRADNAGAAYLFDARSGRFLRRLTAGTRATAHASFGSSVALSGAAALVGATGHDGRRGSAYLFQAGGGRLRHELTAPGAAPNDYFGQAVALNPDLALVGAPGKDGSRGGAYLFDARRGVFLRMLAPTDPAADDEFGISVALAGPLALVGAPGKDSSRGAAYLFDAASGQQLFKFTASDREAGDQFGHSVALSGGRALIGAPDKASSNGAAYVFETANGWELRKIAGGASGGYFAYGVALEGELALIGADGEETGRGAVYLYHAGRGDNLHRMVAGDRAEYDYFGSSVALSGDRALVGKPSDTELGPGAGAAYLCRPLAAPLTMAPVATRGAAAAGAGGATFNGFSKARVKPNDRTALLASLRGAGTSGGRARGIWQELTADPSFRLALRTNDTEWSGGLKAASLLEFYNNSNALVLMHARLRGPGVRASNQHALLRHDVTGLRQIARAGDEFDGFFPGIVPRRFLQTVQAGPSQDRVASAVLLQRGIHGVDASNDSAICVFNHNGSLLGQPSRVGGPVDGGGTLGQLAGRAGQSYSTNFCVFSGAWRPAGGGAAKRAVYYNDGFAAPARVATQDAVAAGAGGARYRSMLAEGIGTTGYFLWRASLSGADVRASSNEGLWHSNASGHRLIARKGQEVNPAGRPGVTISRLLRFWPALGHLQAMMLVRLSGPGINASNDLALCLWDETQPGSLHVLLQEGEPVEGAEGRRVRVIQRIDVDPVNGRYVVQCSLTGSAAGNQALLVGWPVLGNATSLKALRQPVLRLRKGRLHTRESGPPARLRGITLTPALDRTGAGGKGLGQVINLNGNLSVILTFDGNVREVRSGGP